MFLVQLTKDRGQHYTVCMKELAGMHDPSCWRPGLETKGWSQNRVKMGL